LQLNRKSYILLSLAVIGIVLFLVSIHTALYVGAPWFDERANEQWHMNNYIIIPGVVAYVLCAFTPWFLGAFFTGVSIPAFFSRCLLKKQKYLFVFCMLAIGLTTLGFNTFDFMLGCFYWTFQVDPAPVIVDFVLFSFPMNAWNFYFFGFLMPLWVSGFCLGFSIIAKFFKLKL
jgi:hypothetical protein